MAVFDHLAPDTGALQRAMLNEQIHAVEHVLYTFCQPAYVRYHNPDERIGEVHVDRWNNMFTTQPTHLQYVYRATALDFPFIESISLRERLDLFRYLASPFYNCSATIRGGRLPLTPSRSACSRLRKCFESLLQWENREQLHEWAKHIWVMDPPIVSWMENGSLRSYQLGDYRSACPINLFRVLADGEAPTGFMRRANMLDEMEARSRELQLGVPRWNPVVIGADQVQQAVITDIQPDAPQEQIPNYRYPDDPPRDSDTDAFIAEIDALMAEEDTELPPEGTLPKSAPTG